MKGPIQSVSMRIEGSLKESSNRYLRSDDPAQVPPENIFYLTMFELYDDSIWGLALRWKEFGPVQRCYERIGTFSCAIYDEDHFDAFSDAPKTSICIIWQFIGSYGGFSMPMMVHHGGISQHSASPTKRLQFKGTRILHFWRYFPARPSILTQHTLWANVPCYQDRNVSTSDDDNFGESKRSILGEKGTWMILRCVSRSYESFAPKQFCLRYCRHMQFRRMRCTAWYVAPINEFL